jgi:hypothetical protein
LHREDDSYNSTLAPLEPFAATGLPSATALGRELVALTNALAQTSGAPPREGGFLDRLQANAERLHYLLLCARRANDRAAMSAELDELARMHPDSPWRLEALLAMGNSYLVENQVDAYEPLYRACYESFPKEARAAGCHWKVTWAPTERRVRPSRASSASTAGRT